MFAVCIAPLLCLCVAFFGRNNTKQKILTWHLLRHINDTKNNNNIWYSFLYVYLSLRLCPSAGVKYCVQLSQRYTHASRKLETILVCAICAAHTHINRLHHYTCKRAARDSHKAFSIVFFSSLLLLMWMCCDECARSLTRMSCISRSQPCVYCVWTAAVNERTKRT